MNIKISDLRVEYSKKALDVQQVKSDPGVQFQEWLDEAINSKIPDPNAMTLSTVSPEGKPASRMVLLKGLEAGKFLFFTNYESKKGKNLEVNPYAALTFFWPELERQVNIEGLVEKLDPVSSDVYFQSRPRKSQLGAWASRQSQEVDSRTQIMTAFAKYALKFAGRKVPRPPHWGGFALSPNRIEFWQGRPSRLHDRIEYLLLENHWKIRRLSP